MMRDDLAALVQQMIDRGILFDDAQREFERMFIARALAKTNYNVCKAAKMTGPPPQHAQPEDGGVQDQEKRVGVRSQSVHRYDRVAGPRNVHSGQHLRQTEQSWPALARPWTRRTESHRSLDLPDYRLQLLTPSLDALYT